MPENPVAVKMRFIGLLTHEQKQAGYFVSQNEDFVWLWHGKNGHPDIIAVWLYDQVRVKEIRDTAEEHLKLHA